MDKSIIKAVPESPGVYFFKVGEKSIYIGKAINLQRRVSSYFDLNLELKTDRMVREADNFSFIVVNSELEALLLEARLVEARVHSILRLAGETTLKDPAMLYRELIDSDDSSIAVRARFQYASYLNYFYGDAKREEIVALITSLYEEERYEVMARDFFVNVRDKQLLVTEEVLALASVDKKFKDHLRDSGWKDSDFE